MERCCAACLAAHVTQGQRVVVALSGGLDSTSLTHALNSIAPSFGIGLAAVHVHHGLSPNADTWADHCKVMCERLGIPLAILKVDVERGSPDGLEGSARRARHAALAEVDADFIVLAHHRGDQAETLLFNLLRGSALTGAAAMPSRHRRLLRPLLNIPRSEIRTYAERHDLTWVEDESNSDTRLSRNFLRHEIFPLLDERFPAADKNLASACRRFGEALMLLDDLARIDLAGHAQDFPVSVDALTCLSESRARNVLRHLLARRSVQIPGERRLKEILQQVLSAAPDRHPSIRLGPWNVVRRRGYVDIELAD